MMNEDETFREVDEEHTCAGCGKDILTNIIVDIINYKPLKNDL